MKANLNVRTLSGLGLGVLLCLSVAYWAQHFMQPTAQPNTVEAAEAVDPNNASRLFGDSGVGMAAGNLQLSGTVAAVREADSVAMISVDGSAPRAFRIGDEIAPGLKLKEVHASEVVLSQGGAPKRLALPQRTAISASIDTPRTEAVNTQRVPFGVPPAPPPEPEGDAEHKDK